MRKFRLYLLALAAVTSLVAGCGHNNIIYKNMSEQQTEYSVANVKTLMNDVWYAKDGTSFHPLHTFGGESAQYAPNPSGDNILLSKEQENAIPVLYANESIVIRSGNDSVLSDITVERYKPVCWTLGVRSMEYDDDGEYFNASKKDEKENSNIAQVTKRYVNGDHYNIRTINGKSFSLTKAGTVSGMEEDKTYTAGIYVGSEYAEVNVIADSHLYESSETFNISPQELTTIGYIEYKMPEDTQSGIYLIGNAGYVRYIADRKAEAKPLSQYDLTIPNTFDGITHGIDDTLKKSEFRKNFRVRDYVKKLSINLEYSSQYVQVDYAYVILPDGEQLTLDTTTSNEISDPEKGEYEVVMYGYNTMDVQVNHSDQSENIDLNATPTPTPTPSPSPTPTEELKAEDVENTPEDQEEGESDKQTETTDTPVVTPTPTPESNNTGGGTVQQIQVQQTYSEPQYETIEEPVTQPLQSGEIGNTTPG